MSSPVVRKITRHPGIAGQISVTAEVAYEGEEPETVGFVGSVYGGPVVMVLPGGGQAFVTDPDRFGDFGAGWVKRFYA